MLSPDVHRLIYAALDEDVGSGDVTSEFFVDASQTCSARIKAKGEGVIAGADVASASFTHFDRALETMVAVNDGGTVKPGDTVLSVRGPTRSILTAERTALNFLGHLSGIASLTRRFVDAVEGTGVKVLDTRKTTPGWRLLEKSAVAAGGGTNHRFGLFDRVMVKDNHLLAEGNEPALRHAIAKAKSQLPTITVELEADTLDQVECFLNLGGVDVILLDNMTVDQLREAVALTRGSGVALEASGGVSLGTVRSIAETGVDFISVGALTHSAPALDVSLSLSHPQL